MDTIIKNQLKEVFGDLMEKGGKGNKFFATVTEQIPKICEYGAASEDVFYSQDLKTMAHIRLIGFPNAGKRKLLNMISNLKPKVALYPFATLKLHERMVKNVDYEQIAADNLPGLIPGSHKKGLGIQCLKHVEQCTALLLLIKVSLDEP